MQRFKEAKIITTVITMNETVWYEEERDNCVPEEKKNVYLYNKEKNNTFFLSGEGTFSLFVLK